jgi:16S rRNA processing protein RimM
LRESNAWRLVDVVQGKRQGKTVVAQLKGVENRDQAATLMGCDIAVTRADLPPLKAGEYYWTDLIGATVVDDKGVSLGLVDRLFETGANDVMVVRGAGHPGSEILIPWVLPSVITQVDLQQRRITVDWDSDY